MKIHPAVLKRGAVVSRGVCTIALALSASGLALAGQQQQEQPPPTQEQTQQGQQADRPSQSSEQQQTPPVASPQDSNRPPMSQDRVPQNPGQYGQQNPPAPNGAPAPDGPNEEYAPPPALLTIPAGTVVIMRINEPLSSDHNQIGDQFTGNLQQPIVVNGWVVARRG
jgi:hypothetical protein